MKSWQEACFVLYQIWTKPITVRSDLARARADTLAWATARGYLTTEIAPWSREYSNTIKVTQKGLLLLEEVFSGIDREDILSIVNGSFEEVGEQPW